MVDGDVGRIVSLLGGDQSKPHQFIQVAEAMGKIGRPDDVLAWARRGIDATTGWQVTKLFDLSVRVLDERGDTARVLALRREHLERMPSASTYAALKSAAVEVGCWRDIVADARAVLAVWDRGGLVDVLLYQLAARRLKAAKRAATSAKLEAEFAAHLEAVRETHRRRPTLITMLDAAGLR